MLKLDIIRDRRIKPSKMKSKLTLAKAVPVTVEAGDKEVDDAYIEGNGVEDLITELEKMEDFDDDLDDNSAGEGRAITLAKLFG